MGLTLERVNTGGNISRSVVFIFFDCLVYGAFGGGSFGEVAINVVIVVGDVFEGICNQIYLSWCGVGVAGDYVVGFSAGGVE